MGIIELVDYLIKNRSFGKDDETFEIRMLLKPDEVCKLYTEFFTNSDNLIFHKPEPYGRKSEDEYRIGSYRGCFIIKAGEYYNLLVKRTVFDELS